MKILRYTSVLVWVSFLFTSTFASVFANESTVINSEIKYPSERIADAVQEVKRGRKVSIRDTIIYSGEDVSEDRFVVFYKKSAFKKESKSLSNKVREEIEKLYTYDEVVALPVIISKGEQSKKLNELERNPNVIAVSQSLKRYLNAYPNPPDDPRFPVANSYSDNSKQWYLNQPSGGNYGIDIVRAWGHMDSQAVSYGGQSSVIVAVIDSGAAFENYLKYAEEWEFAKSPDFTDNIYVNVGETANNQLDDDVNGYFDDFNGLHLVDYDKYESCVVAPDPENPQTHGCGKSDMGHANDTMGHGTFVSNIIAAKTNNASGVSGIAPGVSIMPIALFGSTYDGTGANWSMDGGYSDQIVRGVEYAVANGAKVINMSFGGPIPDVFEELAMDQAYYVEDVLLVAASGNNGNTVVQYPAGYDSVMAIGATNKNGSKTSYSSYGSHLDLSAPVSSGIINETYTCYLTSNQWDNDGNGEACMSSDVVNLNPTDLSYPPNIMGTGQFSIGSSAGTSFAAPQVSGVAALVWSLHPTLTSSQVRFILRHSASDLNNGFSSNIGYGILNAYNAIRAVDNGGNSIAVQERILQSIRGTDGSHNTSLSDDGGQSFTSFMTDSTSQNHLTSFAFDSSTGRLIQTRVGSARDIQVRISTDFGDTWSSWVFGGYSRGEIATVVAVDTVIQARWATDFGQYTRRSTDGGTTWSAWVREGTGSASVTMIYDPTSGRVIQSIRGKNGYMYTRTSSNKAVSWTSWERSSQIIGEVRFGRWGSRVIQTVRRGDNRIISRYSRNGGQSWSSWGVSGSASSNISMVSTPNRVIQSVRGTDGAMYTRISTSFGQSWGGWAKTSNAVVYEGSMVYLTPFNKVFQSVMGTNEYIYHRYSTDQGSNWSSWQNGGSKTSSDIVNFVVETGTLE